MEMNRRVQHAQTPENPPFLAPAAVQPLSFDDLVLDHSLLPVEVCIVVSPEPCEDRISSNPPLLTDLQCEV